jgi:Zn-dependent M28 family amino/carboxypeptidase
MPTNSPAAAEDRRMPPTFPLLLALALQPPADVSAAEDELSEAITAAELKAHVHRLASPEFAGRQGAGGARAARYIEGKFRALKLKPAFGDSYTQVIPGKPGEEGGLGRGRNVGAFLPGRDPAGAGEWVVLSAHFDHLGVRDGRLYPGADDNASGTAMLLEVAEQFALQQERPLRAVYFVAFDLEEVGLLGSAHFAAHPPRDLKKLAAFLTGDMLGRSTFDLFDDLVMVMGSESSPALRKLLEENPPGDGLKAGRLGADLMGPPRSDFGPFRERQVPFLFFCTGPHADYHQPTDLPGRLNYPNLTRVSRWLAALTRKLADADAAPAWAETEPDLDEVRTMVTLLAKLLQHPDRVPLTEQQRKLATGFKEGLEKIVARGRYTPQERAGLVRMAQWLAKAAGI